MPVRAASDSTRSGEAQLGVFDAERGVLALQQRLVLERAADAAS